MHFYFDESGDFAFPDDRYDCYSQAGVICPDSRLADVEAFVAERCERWGVGELHAVELSPGQRVRVCRYVAQSDLRLVAQATDTDLTKHANIQPWRLEQARTLRSNLDWYREAGGESEEIETWMVARAKSADHATRISNSEFVQAVLIVDLIHAALQQSLLFYFEDRWREDFQAFRFILDGKLPGKLGPGEKFLQHALVPLLGSNARFSLALVDAWKDADPPHPFIERFESHGGWSGASRRHVDVDVLDVKGIFEDGLRFEPSDRHAGLQVADVVAYVVRWAVMQPQDRLAQMAYDLLRPKLRSLDGKALTLVRLSTARHALTGQRYRHLV